MFTPDAVKAIVADDHPLFRAALTQAILQSLGQCQIVEAQSFPEVREALSAQPEVEFIFLDLNMPGCDGFSGLTELRHTWPDILVIMVSGNEDPAIITRAIHLGASGYIPKSASLTHISEAVDMVANGEIWLPQDIDLSQVTETESEEKKLAAKVEKLTPAQFKVLQLLTDGLLNKQIAWELQIQERTVKHHVSAILEKLEVNNRTQAGLILQQLRQV